MCQEKKNIFMKDVEVPTIVQNKADTAFSKIIMEGTDNMEGKENKKIKKHGKTRYHVKNSAAAAACICILVMGSITAVAAVYHQWSLGMQGRLQATVNQQNDLVNSGITTILSEDTSYDSMQVTSENITIKPLEIITDGHFVHISFSIEGYAIDDVTEYWLGPDFESVLVTAENEWVNGSGVFYDGIVTGIDGKAVYDNGEALKFAENGDLVSHYKAEDGTLEFVMTIYKSDINDNLLGDTIHVEFTNLRTEYHNVNTIDGTWSPVFTNETNGTWSFDITLPEKNAVESYTLDAVLGNSGALVKSVELSPISIKVNYDSHDFKGIAYEEKFIDSDGKETLSTFYTEPPAFCGVRLKDGTLLPISCGGMMGYTGLSHTEYYSFLSFNRVIDTSCVDALLFMKYPPNEERPMIEDNLYIVPLNASSK